MNYSFYILNFAFFILIALSASSQIRELQLPDVPDTITEPAARADFGLLHFWDGMDFSDTSLIGDSDFMEQSFVNYLSLFPHANQDRLQQNVDVFLDKAAMNVKAYSVIYDLAGTYLNNSDSPVRNEGYYILFLNHAVDRETLDEADRKRAGFRLEMAMKNRPGMIAPDFRLVTRRGEVTDFHKLLKDGDNIVIFYDPDCDHCADVMKEIASAPSLQTANIIAIDSEDDRLLWEDTKSQLPAEWVVAFSLDPIQDEERYIFPEMPTIYVIDRSGIVKIKEASFSF